MVWGTIGAALAGGLAASQQDGDKTATRTTRLPDWKRNQLQDALRNVQESGSQMRFVGPAEEQQYALEQMRQYANSFSPQEGATAGAQQLAQDTLGGQYLSPQSNPALGDAMDAATGQVVEDYKRQVLPQIGSSAQQAGAFGGARHGLAEARSADQVSENVADLASQMQMQAYDAERQRQQRALQMAPQLDSAMVERQMLPMQMLGEVGQTRRGWQQERENFDFNRDRQIANAINSAQSGRTMSRTRPGPSSEVQFLQGAMGGAQLGNNLGLDSLFDSGNGAPLGGSSTTTQAGGQGSSHGGGWGANRDFTNISLQTGGAHTTGLNAYNKPSYRKTGKVGNF